MKIAIFVEGQGELIFVREFLLKWFNYEIDLECRNLLTDEKFNRAEYDHPILGAYFHAQIINVGGDENVLQRILNREQYMYNQGYDFIVGLRDMYSCQYRKKVKNQAVDLLAVKHFQLEASKIIHQRAKFPNSIRFCFAIMELEAWWLGIPSLWKTLDINVLSNHQVYFDSPETVFHPALLVDKLFQTKQEAYSKRRGEVESIVGTISREDYLELYESQRAPSFCEFVNHIQSN